MPTKKKRVGFIPREDVMKIIDKLSLENNLSNSKIISILVEEALSARGLFNKKTFKQNNSHKSIEDKSQNLSENYNNHSKLTLLKQTNQDAFDLQTYKKFLSFLKFEEIMEKYSN